MKNTHTHLCGMLCGVDALWCVLGVAVYCCVMHYVIVCCGVLYGLCCACCTCIVSCVLEDILVSNALVSFKREEREKGEDILTKKTVE